MKKILTVVGARPQFVKAAMVSRVLAACADIQEIMVHTGQHYDAGLSEIFFSEMGIPSPHWQLDVGSETHGVQTGRMLEKMEAVLLQEKPDWVVVYGDTNSTLAGALAAVKLHIPIAHVEAGLRSYNRKMPEEINRIVTDQLSDLLFAPTAQSVQTLEKEGYPTSKIVASGDVMFDAALWFGDIACKNSTILKDLQIQQGEYVLVTVHRAENTDHPQNLSAIFAALLEIAADISVILPLHPRTRKALALHAPEILQSSNIRLIPPVGFLDMIMLEKHAALIMTDSGGVQKEAYFYQVPCVTLRTETEWTETVELGWNRLAKPGEADQIHAVALQAIRSRGSAGDFPYGRGNTAEIIAGHFS